MRIHRRLTLVAVALFAWYVKHQPECAADVVPATPCGDVDGDGQVGSLDLSELSIWLTEPTIPDHPNTYRFDLNGDGRVEVADQDIIVSTWGTRCRGPSN